MMIGRQGWKDHMVGDCERPAKASISSKTGGNFKTTRSNSAGPLEAAPWYECIEFE